MIYLLIGGLVFDIFKLDCIVVLIFLLKLMSITLKIHLKSGFKFIKKGTREMKPHKHAELIKAWADGAEIEFSESLYGDWIPTKQPEWSEKLNYRIKPEPKPDVISYVFCTKGGTLAWKYYQIGDANLKLTFDGETGELKSAEVLK